MKKSDSLVVYNASYTMNKQIELEWEARKWREREKKSEFGLREPIRDVYMYMWAYNYIGLSVESFIISTDYNSKRKLPKFRSAVAEENWGRGYFCWN